MRGYDHWKTTPPPQWEDYDICCGEPVPVGEPCPTCEAPFIGDNLTGHMEKTSCEVRKKKEQGD